MYSLSVTVHVQSSQYSGHVSFLQTNHHTVYFFLGITEQSKQKSKQTEQAKKLVCCCSHESRDQNSPCKKETHPQCLKPMSSFYPSLLSIFSKHPISTVQILTESHLGSASTTDVKRIHQLLPMLCQYTISPTHVVSTTSLLSTSSLDTTCTAHVCPDWM